MYATSKLIIPPKISRDSPYVPKIRICLRPSPSLDKHCDMGTSLGSDQVLREDSSHSDNGMEQQDPSASCEDQRLPTVGDRPSKASGKQKPPPLDLNKIEGSRSSRKRKSLASFDNIDLERRDSILTKISLKNLINKENFEALPLESRRKLVQLLPLYDRVRPPPGISLGDETGEAAKSSNCDGNAGDGDTTTRPSVPLLWVHPTALNNEFLSKALQDYSARQLNGEFAPRQNGRSGLRKTVGNRSRYSGLPVSPTVAAATAPMSATTNTSASLQNGTQKSAPVPTSLSPSSDANSFSTPANASTATNLTGDETDTRSGASAGADQSWECVPKPGSSNLLPGLRNNDSELVETAVPPDKNLATDIKLATLPSLTTAVSTIASSVSGTGNRKPTNGVKKPLTKGQLKRPSKAEMEEKGQLGDIQRITTRLSRKRKASAPAAASAATADASAEAKDEIVFSTSTSSSPSRSGSLLLPSKLFRIDTHQRRRFASTTTVPCNRPASLADDELDDEEDVAEEADDENEGPRNATQSPSTTTTSEGYSPVELESRKLSFPPTDAAATAAACAVPGKGNSGRIDWPTKPTACALVTPSRRLSSSQHTKTGIFSTPRGSTFSKSTKDREASVRVKSESGSSKLSTLEMPPPRQTKTLASVREKLRAKRMLLEHQRSGPHPPLGSLTPNPGLSHTGNFYSSPFYRQPLTSPSTVSSACLSSSQLTALNIDAQFPSQSSAQQSSKCVLPLTSVGSALESLDNSSQNTTSSLDLFTSNRVIMPQLQHQSSQPQKRQVSPQQQQRQQQQSSDTGFPQSVSAPATPHHERQTDRLFAPRSTISTPAGSRALSSQASPISTSQSVPSINSKVVQLFSSLRQARVVLAPSCSVSNSSLSSDVEMPSSSAVAAAASTTVPALEVSPPLSAPNNGADVGGCDDNGAVGCAGGQSSAKPSPTALCAPPSKTSPLQPAATATAAPAANGAATTRAFFVDGNNLSETLALLQSMNPQATVTQQQFLLIPSSDRSFMYLWRTPVSGCLKSVQQPVQQQQQQLHQQVQQTQMKVESIELPSSAASHGVVSTSTSVVPEVAPAKVDSSGRPTVVSYPSLMHTKHQQPPADMVDGRRSSLTLPLILPATQPPTSLSSSSRGLVSDLPISSQPQLKPSVTTAAASIVSHAPLEPSSGYREILPSPVEGKTLIANARPPPGAASSSTGLVIQSSASRLPQLAPNDQRRISVFYQQQQQQQQQQHHVDVIPSPQSRQPPQPQQHHSTPAVGTTTATFILNTSGGTPVSLVERNIVISSNHLRSLPAGVTAFPVSFQPAASVPPPPPPPPPQPHEQQPTAITSPTRLVAQPLQPKEYLH